METTYTMIGVDGRQYGPITLQQLVAWVNESRVTPETKIMRSDTNAWLPAAQYSELGLPQTVVLSARPTSIPSANPAIERQVRSGARWFYWIAAFSLVNTFIAMSSPGTVFIVGLGITQVIDGLASGHDSGGKMIGLVLNIIVAGIFAMFGFFASKRHSWSFIVGMVLYALDALIFLLAGDWLGLAFHAFALFCIFTGLRANLKLNSPGVPA
ncbi:MAG: hypothetical protein JWR26_3963 [Pedosphaera sp.]|nr:hypothetical protein [Pedosphaera sp.]